MKKNSTEYTNFKRRMAKMISEKKRKDLEDKARRANNRKKKK